MVRRGTIAGSTVGDAQPLPSASRVVETMDGDVVVVPHDARVTVVTRSQVQARLVYVAAQRTLLLITDPAVGFAVGQPEAMGFLRWELKEPWPLATSRWEGRATLVEYQPSERAPFGLAIHTDLGTILIGPPYGSPVTLTPAPVATLRIGSGGRRAASGSFDEIEQQWLAGGDAALGPGPRAGVRVQAHGAAVPGGVSPTTPPPGGAYRGGGPGRPCELAVAAGYGSASAISSAG